MLSTTDISDGFENVMLIISRQLQYNLYSKLVIPRGRLTDSLAPLHKLDGPLSLCQSEKHDH